MLESMYMYSLVWPVAHRATTVHPSKGTWKKNINHIMKLHVNLNT